VERGTVHGTDVQVGGDQGAHSRRQFGLEDVVGQCPRSVAQVEDHTSVEGSRGGVGEAVSGDEVGGGTGGAVGEDVALGEQGRDLGDGGRAVPHVDHERAFQ